MERGKDELNVRAGEVLEEKSYRHLKRRMTRRQVIKAGGLAALGLAFSKPIIDTIRPTPLFANYGGGSILILKDSVDGNNGKI